MKEETVKNEIQEQTAGSAGDTSEKDRKYAKKLYSNIWDCMMKDSESFEAKITSVAFGITVIFIAYVISKGSGLTCLPVGITGASFLLLCIISDMSSFIIGTMVKRKFADMLDEYISHATPIDLYGMADKPSRDIDTRNLISAILLLLGMILTAIFIFVNI